MKSLLVATSLLIAQVQPMLGEDRSLLEYAVTQGGLLLFTLVLLYFYRKDHQRIEAKDAEKLSILVDLVTTTKTALVTQSQTIQQLVRVVEKIEERRGPERRER